MNEDNKDKEGVEDSCVSGEECTCVEGVEECDVESSEGEDIEECCVAESIEVECVESSEGESNEDKDEEECTCVEGVEECGDIECVESSEGEDIEECGVVESSEVENVEECDVECSEGVESVESSEGEGCCGGGCSEGKDGGCGEGKGCDSCEISIGRGCIFCRKGKELTAEMEESCFKLHVTDWLAEYPNNLPEDILEVRFKNTHRGYYQNVNNLPLQVGDVVAVESSPGHNIGLITLTGDMVARQMKRIGFNPLNGEFKKIYRKARDYDIEKWHEAIAREHSTMISARQIAAELKLNMKIGDVEFQGDGIKAIFYYIADERVDFRELIKVFAEQFRIRIEMKQIGARQEAGRIGGLGSCGRQLCCAQWISGFNSVTTNSARTQDLSLNPQKLAGQCSKLKCCLTYELDSYIDARKELPRVDAPLQTLDGDYFHMKSDILARTMSFSTNAHSLAGMTTLPIERVREIQKLNAAGKKPEKIHSDIVYSAVKEEPSFVNAIGEDSITRFDSTKQNKKRRKNKGQGEKKEHSGGQDRPQGERRAHSSGENNNSNVPNGQNAEKRPNNRNNRNRPQNRKPQKENDTKKES